MTAETYMQIQAALRTVRVNDPQLYWVAEFLAETGVTFDELTSLGDLTRLQPANEHIRVSGFDGIRVVALTDRGYAALTHLRVPDWCDLRDLRERWVAAMVPVFVPQPFESVMRDVARTREADRTRPFDDEIPF